MTPSDQFIYADRGRWRGDVEQPELLDLSSKQRLDQFK